MDTGFMEGLGIGRDTLEAVEKEVRCELEAELEKKIGEIRLEQEEEIRELKAMHESEMKEMVRVFEEKMKEMRVSFAIIRALEHRSVDPALTETLIDRASLELREDGSVSGLDEQIDALMEEKPFLFSDSPKIEGVMPYIDGPGEEEADSFILGLGI